MVIIPLSLRKRERNYDISNYSVHDHREAEMFVEKRPELEYY